MYFFIMYDNKSKALLKLDHFSHKMNKVSSGIPEIDEFLGGYETDVITTLYGPSGSGKSNICLLSACHIAKGRKVLYIDTEGGFSIERLKQICPNYMEILKNIFVMKPTNFDEQIKSMTKVKQIISSDSKNIGIIIIDTISMLYRLELGTTEDVYDINRALGKQIAQLAEIARKNNIPVLITNQVYADFDEKDKVNMVGGDLLKYGSKCLVELQKTPDGLRRAVIRKHRAMPEGQEMVFKIIEKGIEKAKESKGFKLF